MDDPRRPMYDEVLQRPAYIRGQFDALDALVRTTLPRDACRRWTRVLMTGCGDSYYAGLASEQAFEACSGLPVDVQPSLQGGRYTIPSMAPPAVVFSISHSGRVARTIETAALARAHGLDVVAVSGNPGSPITQEATWTLAHPLQVSGRTPGVRSYTQAQLLLMLAGIYIGVCRGTLDPAQASVLKEELRRTADILDASLAGHDATASALASAWAEMTQFLVVSGGPNYANALFSAAKLVEACGVNAVGQELEEWAHIQFFLRTPGLPTLLIAPPGRCFDRAVELAKVMQELGCLLAVVEGDDASVLSPSPAGSFTIHGSVPEIFSSLLTSAPAELLACHLAHQSHETFFRASARSGEIGRGRLTESHIVRSAEDFIPPFGRLTL